ncbi:MAG TPA: SDR family oxidoreductase [Pirellulales bacterium]|jgi:glucose 1-dehydrogenase|nr:SDR family oxidoreductase [Pirellulales bacterium]
MILAGKVALVTGASRGIGRAAALALAEAGADVVVNYLAEPDDAARVVDDIGRLGRRGLAIEADVADHLAVDEMVRQARAELGGLDVAVTNAAFSDREPFHLADLRGFARTIDVTMWGAFHTLRAAALAMIEQAGGGSIVVVSSPHARIAVPGSMAYNMAKAAIDQMARTAALELAEHRIRVNILHPGWIDTPGERKFASESQLEQAGLKLPWKRLGQPEEIARGIVFLCDPASEYITGSTLNIDGGITLPWWANRGSAVPE